MSQSITIAPHTGEPEKSPGAGVGLLLILIVILVVIGLIFLFPLFIQLLWNASITKIFPTTNNMTYWQAFAFFFLVIVLGLAFNFMTWRKI
jgi:hypothetical protein